MHYPLVLPALMVSFARKLRAATGSADPGDGARVGTAASGRPRLNGRQLRGTDAGVKGPGAAGASRPTRAHARESAEAGLPSPYGFAATAPAGDDGEVAQTVQWVPYPRKGPKVPPIQCV